MRELPHDDHVTATSEPPPAHGPGPVRIAVGVLSGVASLVLGLVFLRLADSPLGGVGAALFLVCALVILNSAATLVLARLVLPVPAREHSGRGEVVLTRLVTLTLVGQTNLLLLGCWFLTLGLVGGLTSTWLWAVLAVVPAVYFLGFPVLFVAGRFRPGGVRLTDTHVVDEHFGVRRELALADVVGVSERPEVVELTPRTPGDVRRTHLTPRPWRARFTHDGLDVHTRELPGGSAALADLLRRRAS